MKKHLLTFSFLFISILFSEAFAQNFQPFRRGLTYHFIAHDSVYAMKVDFNSFSGSDSVFVFNRTMKRGLRRTGMSSCVGTGAQHVYHEQDNNQFGARMKKQLNGDYVFTVLSGSTFQPANQEFRIKTLATVGQTWYFGGLLDATMFSVATETFNGITDMVKTINLSNGSKIKISENYGILEAPNFTPYVATSDFKKRTLLFHKLPEKQIGEPSNSPFKIFDFQVNDQYCYYKRENYITGLCFEEWNQFKILSRKNSLNGDSIYYTREHKRLFISLSWCSGRNTTLYPTVIDTLIITANTTPEIQKLTNGFVIGSPYYPNLDRAIIHQFSKISVPFHQRETLNYIDYGYRFASCGGEAYYTPDVERAVSYTIGLGKTYEWTFPSTSMYTEELQGYIKGTETFGTCVDLSTILANARESEPQPFSIFPNPFSNEITVQLNPNLQTGKTRVSLLNILGQEVYAEQINTRNQAEIKIALPELPKGIYIFKLQQNGKTYTSKLVKE